MKKFIGLFFCCAFMVCAGCDLQPKIASIPDSVGEFISQYYPTLLADPDSEIYQTAASDYGVYSSTTEYGSAGVDDYVLYAPADDYSMPNQTDKADTVDVVVSDDEDNNTDDKDTDYGYAPDTDVDDLEIPNYVNEEPVKKQSVQETPNADVNVVEQPKLSKATEINEIIVNKGDTLYSLARKYSVPAEDLAQTNNLSSPFKIFVGQKLKMPTQKAGETGVRVEKTSATPVKNIEQKPEVKTVAKTEQSKKKTETKPVVARAAVHEIVVEKGDTLYSLSRKYSVPVNDLAVMNKIAAPFVLSPGQKLQVPEDNKTAIKTKKVDAQIQKKTEKKSGANTNTTTKPAKVEVKKTVAKTAIKKTDTKKVQKKDDKKTAKQQDSKSVSQQHKKSSKQNTQKMMARSSSKFAWPVRGKILSGYGAKSNGLFNDGINIKAARGTVVSASENGFVAYAGNEVKGMGNLVIIQHADGWMTVYAHMDSFVVRRGHSVAVGQKIGTVGVSGKVDQAQLHFEIRKGTKAYNPINYLKK